MTDRTLLERILSREDGVLGAGSSTEYEWLFADAVLRVLVTNASPFRVYEYRFVRIADGSRVSEAGADEERVREFVEDLLVSAGEDPHLLEPSVAETGCGGWLAVAVTGDARIAEIVCPFCDRSGSVSRAHWDTLPRLGIHERRLTPEQHRLFFGASP